MRGEVYAYSNWTALQAAELYYMKDMTQKEISSVIGVSPATVSRLIRRAKSEGIVRFYIEDSYRQCLDAADRLKALYGIKDIIVVNTSGSAGGGAESAKRMVAREGARYLQRVLLPGDVLGVAWGGTMYHLIHFLNPCQKSDNSFVTLHGSLDCCDYELDVGTLTRRMAMALGGQHFELLHRGLAESPEELSAVSEQSRVKSTLGIFDKTTISVSGIGAFAPGLSSPLARMEYLPPADLRELQRLGVCADLMLRFIDRNGEELPSSVRSRTLSIELETYRRIPRKIIVASGAEKALALRAALRGGLADTVVIDDSLAQSLLQAYPPCCPPA